MIPPDPGGNSSSSNAINDWLNGLIAPNNPTPVVTPLPGVSNPNNQPANQIYDDYNTNTLQAFSSGVLVNPPLDPKTETPGWIFPRVKLRRGWMVREMDRLDDKGRTIPVNKRYRFRFLFNPDQIAYTTSVFAGLVAPEYQDPNNTYNARFPGQEQVSFSLMLDRTQEAYSQGDKTRGTLTDVQALYKVLNGVNWNQGFLQLALVSVFFGGDGVTYLPKFPGYVTSVNVTHTLFTPKLTPVRSIVNLTVNRISTLNQSQLAAQGLDTTRASGSSQ